MLTGIIGLWIALFVTWYIMLRSSHKQAASIFWLDSMTQRRYIELQDNIDRLKDVVKQLENNQIVLRREHDSNREYQRYALEAKNLMDVMKKQLNGEDD